MLDIQEIISPDINIVEIKICGESGILSEINSEEYLEQDDRTQTIYISQLISTLYNALNYIGSETSLQTILNQLHDKANLTFKDISKNDRLFISKTLSNYNNIGMVL